MSEAPKIMPMPGVGTAKDDDPPILYLQGIDPEEIIATLRPELHTKTISIVTPWKDHPELRADYAEAVGWRRSTDEVIVVDQASQDASQKAQKAGEKAQNKLDKAQDKINENLP